ncbi:Dyp-type peroxidase [Undibacterium sp.]|jgi:putative iron-dependent peroxidase|uniref:Dyp-type peroxidase n=1 Tax=Undibacterium sp. TaxID=1914977 RepID=UPI002BAA8584|nr:Dyp-type peroxidase [Undibacterium sp.]HTD06723.1 Dyp-type peroxidase [Undibacterium sp.]
MSSTSETSLNIQPGILQAIPAHGRYLSFSLKSADALHAALANLLPLVDGESVVLGVGHTLATSLGAQIPGLRDFTGIQGSRVRLPATPAALWCWLRASERYELVHRTRRLLHALSPAFELQQAVEAFRVGSGRDLTGYEDGTENPKGEEAVGAAFVQGQGAGLDGGSFAAVQLWQHQFDKFEAMAEPEQDDMMGRRRSDNEELDEAPVTAHVKRTAQESFDPEAFVLRRSMPWSDVQNAGLHFVAFGKSFHAFEAQLRRMSGAEDQHTDALFGISKPVTGGYFWCPPLRDGKPDLRALNLV